MLVTNVSPFSGTITTLELDVTPEQLHRYSMGKEFVQDVFPKLSAFERDFIMIGMTKTEWEDMYGEAD